MKFQLEKYKRSYTDDELLESMRVVAIANNGKVTQKLYREYRNTTNLSMPDDSVICRQIGWNNAVALIGLELGKYQNNKKISEEELLSEILRLWTEFGRQPTTTDLKNGLSKYPRNRFNDRFGSWIKALERFVGWVNNEGLLPPEPTIDGKYEKRTPRNFNLRQRWIIMNNNNFRCVVCGAVQTERVKLHVDHIKPYDGFNTVIENGQVLCQNCNLGKSNLV
ncbi:MAG: HNH endonuclease [Defluviitaleaceae bacterium]|nr:HNH endonuclease [Defluviitaleaceae bacterium]